MIDFSNVFNFNITELLNSPIALGEIRGDEIWLELDKYIDGVPDGSLILINLRDATWIDTAFCVRAFGPLFKAFIDKRWSCKYVIFKMLTNTNRNLFQGILRFIGKDVKRKEAEEEFISAELYTKIMVESDELISFIGNLDHNERTILTIVNKVKDTTALNIAHETNISIETVVKTLDSFIDKYFIILDENNLTHDKHYLSFYNFIK